MTQARPVNTQLRKQTPIMASAKQYQYQRNSTVYIMSHDSIHVQTMTNKFNVMQVRFVQGVHGNFKKKIRKSMKSMIPKKNL